MIRIAQWASDQMERWQLGAPYWVGPMGEIALSLDLRWEPERLFMIVNIYADESYDDKIFVMALYIGTLGRWNKLEKRWPDLLKKYQVSYFHSKEMTDRDNDFASWNRKTEQDFCREAEILTRGQHLTGMVARINREDFRVHYREYRPIKGFSMDSIYGLAFRYLLSYLPSLVKRSFPYHREIKINAILENSHYFGDALRIWNELKNVLPDFGDMLGTCIPGDKTVYGLQVADALATGALRLERNIDEAKDLGGDLQETVTLSSLRHRSLRRAPAIRCCPTPEDLRNFKDAIQAEHRNVKRALRSRRFAIMSDPNASAGSS